MAYLVARSDGRYEIRESLTTAKGPRSRTLATFRVLTDAAVETAVERATSVVDAEMLRRDAADRGIPTRRTSTASRLARELLGELRRGHRPSPVLVRMLKDGLGRAPKQVPDTVVPAAEWLGASPAKRGKALRDLLRLTSRIPAGPPRGQLAFPRISSAGDAK